MYTKNYFAGTTAILYNFDLTANVGDFSIDAKRGEDYSTWQSRTGITEMGVRYKKATDSTYQTLTLAHPMSMSGFTLTKTFQEFEENDFLYMVPSMTANIYQAPSRVLPIRIVIRNLSPATTYNVESYCVKGGQEYTFNSFTISTMAKGDITYTCTNIVGGSEQTRTRLSTLLTTACEIYNSMTAFRRSNSVYAKIGFTDYLNSSSGGSFTAYLDSSSAGAADSTMHFQDILYYLSLETVTHEMAHNLMFPIENFTPGTEAYTKMQTFMEFASFSDGATWKWLSAHNYPVITKELGSLQVNSYLRAAACWVCRDAGGYV